MFFFSKSNRILVCDLDNTLYDTWPSLGKGDMKRVYSIAPIFEGVKNCVLNFASSGDEIVFLSARRLRFLGITNKRLKSDFPDSKWSLILVEKAEDKIPYLSWIADRFQKVTFIDDLSYNHEENYVKTYSSVIEGVSKLDLIYVGLNEIKEINENN